MASSAVPAVRPDAAVPIWVQAAGPALLYGLRLSTAVCLALFVAFYLQLDNPSWAGTSAAIVCQPILGASLRKGLFRAIGTVVGATMAVVLTGIFPQSRTGFLMGMALWMAACAFGGTLTRNFAAYAFALSGYTLAIIAGDSISAPGHVFELAIARGSEILIGNACATLVMGLSDLGRSREKLYGTLEGLARDVLFDFTTVLRGAGARLTDGPGLRRALLGRIAALDPLIDQAIGESPELRHRQPVLRAAMAGLFSALSGWRIAEAHLASLPPEDARHEAQAVAEVLPERWRSAVSSSPGIEAPSDFRADRHEDLDAVRRLAGMGAASVSQRLLADAVADVALGLTAAVNGLALIRDPAAARDLGHSPGFVVADYLPAVVNAIRVFMAVGAVILFWIVTEWPNGLGALTFTAVTVMLLAPQQERSGPAALGFGIGTMIAACLAAFVDFALLPNHEGFLNLALIMSAVLVPLAALSTVRVLAPYLVAATMNFVPLLGPTNEITFNTLAYYNAALGIVGGCLVGAIALTVIPPVPARLRASRLVDLTFRDLRRMAAGRWTPSPAAWQNRVYARLTAMPESVDPAGGFRVVAALSLGLQVLRLRSMGTAGRLCDTVTAALGGLARGDIDALLAGLDRVDTACVPEPGRADGGLDGRLVLRVRTATQVMRDVVRQHRHAFGGVAR